VRTLCPHCKVQHDYEASAWDALVAPWKSAYPKGTTYINQGCLECRMTGYAGRIGIYEMMVMTPPLRERVVTATDLDALREAAYKDGMKPLRISGALKIAAGITTIDEIMKVAPPPGGDRRARAR
jgi:general secretion pathway protein E